MRWTNYIAAYRIQVKSSRPAEIFVPHLVPSVFTHLATRLGARVECFLPLPKLEWLVLTSDEEYGGWVCCDGT